MKSFWHILGTLFLLVGATSVFASDVDVDVSCGDKTEKSDESKDDKEKDEKKEPTESDIMLKVGNLSFPSSQQPGPMISIGQNVLDKKQLQMQSLTTYLHREHNDYFIGIIPSIVYGFTDQLTLLVTFPFVIRDKMDCHHASGGGDIFFQLEYAYYTKYYETFYDQATLIGAVSIPTGSAKKNPQTGYGSNSVILGGTYSRMGIDWFGYVSGAGNITASSHGFSHGDTALYQFGFGRRIWNSEDWLFDWQVECDGTYTWRDKIFGVTDPNSGGTLFLVTPSLWLSSQDLILQLGFGFPVQQHLFGDQEKTNFTINLNTVWTF
jgi:hypothetical protein